MFLTRHKCKDVAWLKVEVFLSYLGVSQNRGTLFGCPYNKDYSILGSILGSPYFGKLPSSMKCIACCVEKIGCLLHSTKDEILRMRPRKTDT